MILCDRTDVARAIAPSNLHLIWLNAARPATTAEDAMIGEFWTATAKELAKYKGLRADNVNLFLGECLWRFRVDSVGDRLRSLHSCLRDDFR